MEGVFPGQERARSSKRNRREKPPRYLQTLETLCEDPRTPMLRPSKTHDAKTLEMQCKTLVIRCKGDRDPTQESVLLQRSLAQCSDARPVLPRERH
eukprot:1745990-Rhodomonas_salina.1